METETLLVSLPRTMLRPEDATRLARPFRLDDSDRPRAASENRINGHAPDLAASLDDSPPRSDMNKPMEVHKNEPTLLTLDETTALFQQKIADAQKDTEHALAGSEEVSGVVKPKLTLDLGHCNVARLPEQVVDLIKEEVERLSLSHNQIWHIPLRFAECSQLRYLNIRSNVFREIPRGVYKLPLLEILDVSRNKVRRISKEIRNLTCLRVFSIAHNRVDDLPTELCEMSKLQILKITENPLRFKLKKIIEVKEAEVSYLEMNLNERDTAVTSEIKRYLREIHPLSTPVESDVSPEINDSPMETPKPSKRNVSSRFPVIPSTGPSDVTGEKQSPPNQNNVPPIPTRSHYRMASGQGLGIKRPGITPLVSNSSERNRSNSESVLQASAAARSKRMGMLRHKTELDSISESKTNRNSHLRGYSHGSVLKRNGPLPSPSITQHSSSPTSPQDAKRNRATFVKRLSSLPEHKVEQKWQSPIVDGAKGVLYALYQIHPQISGIIAAIKGKDTRRSSLEFTFYNASTHVDRLNQALEQVDAIETGETEALEKAEETVQRDCTTCIKAYAHVSVQLQENVKRIVAGTDTRYVRTLMLLLYGSILEIRNAITSFGMEVQVMKPGHRRQMSSGPTHSIQTIPEEFTTPQKTVRAATPTRDRAVAARPGPRLRSDTAIQHPIIEQLPPPLPTTTHTANHLLHGAYNGSSTSLNNGYSIRSRSNSRNPGNMSATNSTFSSLASTPRSGEGFHLPLPHAYPARVNPTTGMTDAQEETAFEQIFLALTRAYDAALTAIPVAKSQFIRFLDTAEDNRQPKAVHDLWSMLIYRCKVSQDVSEALRLRLMNMRIRESGSNMTTSNIGRNDPSFWNLCKTFLQSFIDLVTDMREAKTLRILPQELIMILRPVQKTSREAGKLIEQSPWRQLTDSMSSMPTGHFSSMSHNPHLRNGYAYTNGVNGNTGHVSNYSNAISKHQLHQAQSPFPPPSIPIPPIPTASTAPAVQPVYGQPYSNGTSPGSVPLPATPLSAALGPAAQATIPSTPASAYNDSFFKGDVFQRADSLLSMPQAGAVNFLGARNRA